MLRVLLGGVLLVSGLLLLLVVMRALYRLGFLGSIFGFVVVIPAITILIYGPATRMINDGRKSMAGKQ